MSVIIKIKKLREDAILPTYKTTGASGMDLYIPDDIDVHSGLTVKIPLGFAVELPAGYELQIRPRSSLSLQNTYLCQLGTVDNDYRGEIAVIIHNPNQFGTKLCFKRGDRIAQAVITPVIRAELVESAELTETERGHGGFGSTGLSDYVFYTTNLTGE